MRVQWRGAAGGRSITPHATRHFLEGGAEEPVCGFWRASDTTEQFVDNWAGLHVLRRFDVCLRRIADRPAPDLEVASRSRSRAVIVKWRNASADETPVSSVYNRPSRWRR
jgi:hypothetical protein